MKAVELAVCKNGSWRKIPISLIDRVVTDRCLRCCPSASSRRGSPDQELVAEVTGSHTAARLQMKSATLVLFNKTFRVPPDFEDPHPSCADSSITEYAQPLHTI